MEFMMTQASRFLLLVSITAMVAGCKLAVIVVEGGEVHSEGSGTCLAGKICIVDVSNPYFSDAFTAVAEEGWYFEQWHKGNRFFCGGSTQRRCVLSFEGYKETEAVEEIVASSQMFYLMPIFKPIQAVDTVDGKEWLQPILFLDLSWDDINAVCPGGVCAGSLNGINLNGWTWASVDEVKTLFNGYIGDSFLDSETDYYKDDTGEAVERFFEDGWRPTSEGTLRDFIGTEWRVMLRDIKLEPDTPRYAGEGYVLLLNEMKIADKPNSPEVVEAGDLVSASFTASVDGEIDDYDMLIGALFYR